MPEGFFYDMTYAAKVFEINFDICTDGSVRIILFSDYPRDSFSVRVSSTKGSSSLLYFKQTGTGRLIDGVIRKCFEFVGPDPEDSRFPYPTILLLGTLDLRCSSESKRS